MRLGAVVAMALCAASGAAWGDNLSVGTVGVAAATICGLSFKIDAVEARNMSSGKVEYSVGIEVVEIGPDSVLMLSEADASYVSNAIKQAVQFNSKNISTEKITWVNEKGRMAIVVKSFKDASPVISLNVNGRPTQVCNEKSLNDLSSAITSAMAKISELRRMTLP